MTRSMKLRNNADRFRRKKEETEERESIKGETELRVRGNRSDGGKKRFREA